MISESVIVTRITARQVWIKRLASSRCKACAQQGQCSTETVNKLMPNREFAIDCELPLAVGDQVKVVIDDQRLVLTALLLYLLPLLLMLIGVGIGNYLLPIETSDRVLPWLALSLLLASFCLIHRLQFRLLILLGDPPQIVGKS